MKAERIAITRAGGPDVLAMEEVEVGAPGPGEILVRHTAIGLNFIDTYHRSGVYPLDYPSGIGLEAAGVVEKVGDGVAQVSPGDRIGYCTGPIGAYTTARVMPADRVVRLPDHVSDETAAATMLKGCTAEYLAMRTATVRDGDIVLVHAAAGGVGSMLVPWLKDMGAQVIGTAGSEEKADLARRLGCAHVILYREQDVAEEMKRVTGGAGATVVFDGVGRSTFETSLKSLRRRGLLVSFGNASGTVENVNLGVLSANGSLYVTRPTLFDYCASEEERQQSADALFDRLKRGVVKPVIDRRYPLGEAAEAQRALEARETTGSTIFQP